jgi:hypothetical protein
VRVAVRVAVRVRFRVCASCFDLQCTMSAPSRTLRLPAQSPPTLSSNTHSTLK